MARQSNQVPTRTRKPQSATQTRKGAAPVCPAPIDMRTPVKPDKSWFVSRLKQIGIAQSHAAARLGMHSTSFGRALVGERKIDVGEASTLAQLLHVSLAEVAARLGYDTGAALVPSGRVLQDGRVSSVIAASAVRLGDYPVGVEVLLVEAPGGPLAPFDGAAVVFRPSVARTVAPDLVGRLCVVEDAGHALPMLGELRQATGARGNSVRILGLGEDVAVTRLVRASPVLGIHLRY